MSGAPDAIVVGAGPYGLATAAHLTDAGFDVRVFGSTMRFWSGQMPRGMLLRSVWHASHIAHPRERFTLDAFEREQGRRIDRPVPLADFIAYGHWFQRHAVPQVDPRHVSALDRDANGFAVRLEDGEIARADRVVVAGGIGPFARRPAEFAPLSAERCSHSGDHDDLSRFAGRRLLVVGGGQSALECAVLAREGGADVEVVIRAPGMRWLGKRDRFGPFARVWYAKSDVGPAFLSHVVGHPSLFRALSPSLQQRVARRAIPPAVARWLQRRADGLPITTGRAVRSVADTARGVRVELDDGSARTVDHVLLGTGYRVDVARYPFLAPLLPRLARVDGYPDLDGGLMSSSVPGLYFVGAPAALAFGPVVRFVSGTPFAARAVTRSARRSRPAGAIRRRVDGLAQAGTEQRRQV